MCENPTTAVNLEYKQTAPRTEPSINSNSAEHKTNTACRTPIWSLKSVWWNLWISNNLRLNIELFFWNLWDLHLEPEAFSLDVEPWSETFMWNLYKNFFMWSFIVRNLHDKPFCETFVWNLYVELQEPESFCGTFLWNLGTFEPLFVEPGNL